jgi:hypothetical protein
VVYIIDFARSKAELTRPLVAIFVAAGGIYIFSFSTVVSVFITTSLIEKQEELIATLQHQMFALQHQMFTTQEKTVDVQDKEAIIIGKIVHLFQIHLPSGIAPQQKHRNIK